MLLNASWVGGKNHFLVFQRLCGSLMKLFFKGSFHSGKKFKIVEMKSLAPQKI